MRTAEGRRLRGRLRGWWGAISFTALAVTIAGLGGAQLAGGNDEGGQTVTFAAFTWIVWAVGFAQGTWRRHLPLADTIDDIHAGMTRVETTLAAKAAPSGDAPVARLRAVEQASRGKDSEIERLRAQVSELTAYATSLARMVEKVYQADQVDQTGPMRAVSHRKPPRHLRVVKLLLWGAAGGGFWALLRKTVVGATAITAAAAVSYTVATTTPYVTATKQVPGNASGSHTPGMPPVAGLPWPPSPRHGRQRRP